MLPKPNNWEKLHSEFQFDSPAWCTSTIHSDLLTLTQAQLISVVHQSVIKRVAGMKYSHSEWHKRCEIRVHVHEPERLNFVTILLYNNMLWKCVEIPLVFFLIASFCIVDSSTLHFSTYSPCSFPPKWPQALNYPLREATDKPSLLRVLSSDSLRKIKWSVWVSGFWRKIWGCGWLNEQSENEWERGGFELALQRDARMLNKFWGSRSMRSQSLVTGSERPDSWIL